MNIDRSAEPFFTPDAVTALCKHNWPGNVRELKMLLKELALYSPEKKFLGLMFTKIY